MVWGAGRKQSEVGSMFLHRLPAGSHLLVAMAAFLSQRPGSSAALSLQLFLEFTSAPSLAPGAREVSTTCHCCLLWEPHQLLLNFFSLPTPWKWPFIKPSSITQFEGLSVSSRDPERYNWPDPGATQSEEGQFDTPS